MKKFVSYNRVSSQEQGQSGLGIAAQEAALQKHIGGVDGAQLIASYKEVESGRNCLRPELLKAIAHARRSRATLLVAKFDRLARSVSFLSALMDSGLDFVACDNPYATKLTVHIMSAVAQNEAEMCSTRTKAALEAAKARGQKLGSARPGHWTGREAARLKGLEKARISSAKTNKLRRLEAYSDLLPAIQKQRSSGRTLVQIAEDLNTAGHTTRRGKKWSHIQVMRLLKAS